MSNKKDTAIKIGKWLGVAIGLVTRFAAGVGITWFYLWTLAKLNWLPF